MPGVVQCGWCPLMLASDYQVWYRHFAQVHRYSGGYSIRHIVSSDWDTRELVPNAAADGGGT